MDNIQQSKQVRVPTVESWLQKYYEQHSKDNSDLVHIPWRYPDQFEDRTDLPPSIKKLKPEYFIRDNYETWG